MRTLDEIFDAIESLITEESDARYEEGWDEGYEQGVADGREAFEDDLRPLIGDAMKDACAHCLEQKFYIQSLHVECCDYKANTNRCGLAALFARIEEG